MPPGERRLRIVPVRMPEEWHALWTRAAQRDGISLAAYFREAALLRWAFESARDRIAEEDRPALAEVEELVEQISEKLHALYGIPRRD